MADWLMLGIIHILVGFEADVLGFIKYQAGGHGTQALLIIAFMCYVVVATMIAMIKIASLEQNLVINIVILVLLGIAVFCLIIGVAIHGNASSGVPYAATLEISAALLGIVGGIFLIVAMVGGGGGAKTSPT